jgi:hypothetical protein
MSEKPNQRHLPETAVLFPDPLEQWEDPRWLLYHDPERAYRVIDEMLDSERRFGLWLARLNVNRRVAEEAGGPTATAASRPEVAEAIVRAGSVSEAARTSGVTPDDIADLLHDPPRLVEVHRRLLKKWIALGTGPVEGLTPHRVLVAQRVPRGWRRIVATLAKPASLAIAATLLVAIVGVGAAKWMWEIDKRTREIAGQGQNTNERVLAVESVLRQSLAGERALRAAGGPTALKPAYASAKANLWGMIVAASKKWGADDFDIYASEDAVRACKQVFIDQFGIPPDRITFLADQDVPDIVRQEAAEGLLPPRQQPTIKNVEDSIGVLKKKVQPGDSVILMVICHGSMEKRQLMLHFQDGTYPAERLLALFAEVNTPLKLAILDSCYSGKLSLTGLADRARTTADEMPQLKTRAKPYLPVLLTSASPQEGSWFREKDRSGIFQQALRDTFRDAAPLSPEQFQQRIAGRVGRLLRQYQEYYQTPQIQLASEAMSRMPLFVPADSTAFGELMLVGEGLTDARIEIDGQEVPAGMSRHYIPVSGGSDPGAAGWQEPYCVVRVELGSQGDRSLLLTGFPLGQRHEYVVSVRTRDGRTFKQPVRFSEQSSAQTAYVPSVPAQEEPAGKPSVRITKISQREGKIGGVVSGVKDPQDYSVLVLIKTDVWYVHPYLGNSAQIAADGSWELPHVVRGSEFNIAALLVRKEDTKTPVLERQGYVVQLAQLGSITVAKQELDYQPEYRRVGEQQTTGKPAAPAPDSSAPSRPAERTLPPPPPDSEG